MVFNRTREQTTRARGLRQQDNPAEAMMWIALKDRRLGGFKFVRQFPIGPYFADFACRARKLVLEIDGSQHVECCYDRRRDAFMRKAGYSVLRVWSVDVLQRRDDVCASLLVALQGLQEEVVAADLRYMKARSLT
jgi:very-short-patch-repair endonuclease